MLQLLLLRRIEDGRSRASVALPADIDAIDRAFFGAMQNRLAVTPRCGENARRVGIPQRLRCKVCPGLGEVCHVRQHTRAFVAFVFSACASAHAVPFSVDTSNESIDVNPATVPAPMQATRAAFAPRS